MSWEKHSDSLSWSQGHEGKGYLLHDGTIKTWSVDPFYPADQRSIWELNNEFSPVALNFEIDPDGGVVTQEPTVKVQTIIQADPRLYDAGQRPVWEDSWDLSDFDPEPKKGNQPDYNFIMSRQSPRGYHYHPFTGRPCTCKWGQPKPKWWEKTSSQYVRQIRNQNQKVFRDEHGQQFLEALERLINDHPDAEAMAPWMASRYKKGDITVKPGEEGESPRLHYYPYVFKDEIEALTQPRTRRTYTPDGRRTILREYIPAEEIAKEMAYQEWDKLPWHQRYDQMGRMRMDRSGELRASPRDIARMAVQGHPALQDQMSRRFIPIENHLPQWTEWFNARQHPTRRGVNIMELSPGDVAHKSTEHQQAVREARAKQSWLKQYGPNSNHYSPEYYPSLVQHTFGPEAGKYQGWHVIKLDPDQAEGDSKALGHCIGSDDQPYKHNIDIGNISAYSLRDKEGYPHVSWHINPSGADIGHMQGKSGEPPDEYRQLISMFNHARGLPDEEGGEEDLEQPYDDRVTIPVNDIADYLAANGDDRYEIAEGYAENGIGPDTEIDTDEDWPSIAHDYLNYHDWDGAEQLHRLMGNGTNDGERMQRALEGGADMTNSDHIGALRHWNEEMYRHEVPIPDTDPTDMDGYIEADANGYDPRPSDWDEIAHDYLNYGYHPEHVPYGHRQPAYDSFHNALWNQDHEDEMQEAITNNLNWDDPRHQQAVGYWNTYWPQRGVDYRNIAPEEEEVNESPPYEDPVSQALRERQEQGGDFQATSAYNWEGLGPMEPIQVEPNKPAAQPRNEQEAIFQMIGEAMEKGDYETARWLYQFLPEEVNPMRQSKAEPNTDILSPAVELREWLADLGGEDPPVSIHHDTPEATIVAPAVSTADDLPYFPPANIPKEYKQSASGFDVTPHEDLWCPRCGKSGVEYYRAQNTQGLAKTHWYCPNCHWNLDREVPTATGNPDVDKLIYQGVQNTWRPQHEVRHDTMQADALMDELGLGPPNERPCANCGIDLRNHPNGEALLRNGQEICGDCYERGIEEEPEEPEEAEPLPVPRPEQGGHRENPTPIPDEFRDRELNCGDCGANLQGRMFAQNPADGQVYCVPCAEERQRLGSTKTADSPINQADATNDPLGKSPALEPSPKHDMDYLDMHQCIRCHQMHRPDEPCPDSAVTQYKQMERQWYNHDPNTIHQGSTVEPWEEDDGLDEADDRLTQMQETIERLAAALVEKPEEKKPRKLVINRDENGKMTSIEEV